MFSKKTTPIHYAFTVAMAIRETTMRELAAEWQVSATTVSRVVRDRKVSPRTHDKVLDFIHEVDPSLLDNVTAEAV